MEREPVDSQSLAEVGYDADTATLEVLFRKGTLYQYYDVPAFVYEQLMQSDSLGRFLNQQIKGHFREARL